MSREGAQHRIDSLKGTLSTSHYERTALGNAVRFNTMINVLNTGVEGRAFANRDEFLPYMEHSVRELTREFNDAIGEDPNTEDRSIQQARSNQAFRSRLGATIADETVRGASKFADANSSPFRFGTNNAFNRFTGEILAGGGYPGAGGDDDFFGSRVLYDNVFGAFEDFEDGTTALSQRLANVNSEDSSATAAARVLNDTVQRSLYDGQDIVDRVDLEYQRFHGDSLIDQLSMTGSGLRSARRTIRNTLANGTAVERNRLSNAADIHAEKTQAKTDAQDLVSALELIRNNVGNRSSAATEGGYVDKAGIGNFVDLVNTAENRVTIQSFQFQNDAISSALIDKIQRRVLEQVSKGDTSQPFQVDLVLAYPRQRNLEGQDTPENRYGVGSTNYNILGPNLIEALKLQEVQNQLQDALKGMGITNANIEDYFRLNVQFRDKKFHPKIYLTDNVAGIGTQNLTGPVGNSINQAGSNFETMRFVVNKYDLKTGEEVRAVRENRSQLTSRADVALKTSDISQSLLYRQIDSISKEEMAFRYNNVDRKGGSTATPILSESRGMQVGFAGDIFQHLKNTLNYAHQKRFDVVAGNTRGGFAKETTSGTGTHMFMVLDQAFMLQLGDTAKELALAGEMGKEVSSAYGGKSRQAKSYYQLQSKLFDLLITGKASVTVDAKNYREQVVNPLIQKIEKNGSERLKSNFNKYGRNLGLMAGYSLFNPATAKDDASYSKMMGEMMTLLRVQGFTEEAGFTKSDLKQIIGMGSDNISMAKAPRQHVKSFGLMEYGAGADPRLISYYMGSSNLGMYSLAAGSGSDGKYMPGDGAMTNTEVGLMFGDRNVDGALSRATSHQARMAQRFDAYERDYGVEFTPLSEDFSLDQEEERHELNLAMRHLVNTWSQLGNNSITNPNYNAIKTEPLWQRNVNNGGLVVLKDRLEQMRKTLGVSETAFKIVDRYGDTSGSGLTSINVSLDLSMALGAKGYLNASARLPKLQFELSVLNGPNRGSDLFAARTDDGDAGAFVYFVDKSQVVGNGIFANNSGEAVSVLGRKNYDDRFVSDIEGDGRVTLQSGESAYMSALDIVPQMFATILGEAHARFGPGMAQQQFSQIKDAGVKQQIATQFVSKMLTGYGDTMDPTTGYKVDAMTNIHTNLPFIQTPDGKDAYNLVAERLIGDLSVVLFGKHHVDMQDEGLVNIKQQLHLDFFGGTIDGEEYHGLAHAIRRMANEVTLEGQSRIMNSDVAAKLEQLANLSPALASQMMRAIQGSQTTSLEVSNFKDFQASLFDSFLQAREARTYGGQQAVYRTAMMGFAGGRRDKQSVQYLFGEAPRDAQGNIIPSINNVGMFARITPLAYRPTTDINAILYRSIASKSTSMNKYDNALDSVFFAQEARQMGTADNLRVMSSVGIGNRLAANTYFAKDDEGAFILTDKAILETFGTTDVSESALQAYKASMMKTFGLNKEGATLNNAALQFYTGSAKKVSQLPQRIKNALGARPFYQFSVAAQAATERALDGEYDGDDNLTKLTDEYLAKNRALLLQGGDHHIGLEGRRDQLMAELKQKRRMLGDDHIEVIRLSRKITNLASVARNAFNDSHSALGAVFSGNIKSVMNQQQMDFLQRTTQDIQDTLGDSVSEELKQELLRVEVLKASLDLNLGKMTAGSDHMRYSMALIQLGGTYTDTFLANPLYGTVYSSKATYDKYLDQGWNPLDRSDVYLDDATGRYMSGIRARGMREGYLETQQSSIKGSMIGEGGFEVLQKRGDIIVQDPNTNSTVLKRKVDGEWRTIAIADHKGNMATIKNVVDNTGFSPVGSPSLGTSEMATYRRSGEQSVDYLMDAYFRGGNFDNNEYVGMFHRLRSVMPGSGRRVEGTDSMMLLKGVANFAGRQEFVHNIKGERRAREMNVFQHLEQQIYANEVGGSLKAYLGQRHEMGASLEEASDYTKLQDGTYGYTPLSSTIHGLYNANNFKSFFWSHGATIMRSVRTEQDGSKSHFMLDELFGPKGEANIATAKKVAGALLLHFGDSFITDNDNGGAKQKGNITKLKRALVEAAALGEYGKQYQKLTAALYMSLSSDNNYREKVDGLTGERRKDAAAEELFNRLTSESSFSDVAVGGLRNINSTLLTQVLSGDADASIEFLSKVRGLVDPSAQRASQYGSINFDSAQDRQAAIITTAVDFLQQVSARGSAVNIPSDIDLQNDDYKAVMLNVLGTRTDIDSDTTDAFMQMIEGLSTQITTVSIFSDIAFSYSKDPTGTQSVARHEGQHLITPFLGDIEQYKQTGQLGKIKHTVASLAAMTSNMKSGLAMYGSQYANQFGKRKARNLVDAESNYLFSSFEKRKFLGFYQGGYTGVYTQDFVDRYDQVNTKLVKGDFEWTADSINDSQRKDVEDYVKAKYGIVGNSREVSRIIEKGGREFAMTQLEDVEVGLMAMNNKQQQFAGKVIGKTNTKEYLANMRNESMYITLPGISFEHQYGQVVAHIDKDKGMSTIIPSAQIMRAMGAQHADFVDPVVQNYKALTAIFTPGHIANVAFEKVRAGAQTGISVMLTTDETKALQSVMEAAATMEVEIEKAVAGARMQEANAGKVKYQGFTSTGIGSNLMPFGSAAMALSKQQELGLETYEERDVLLRETTQNIRDLRTTKSFAQTSTERVYIEMGQGLFNHFDAFNKALQTNNVSKFGRDVQDTIYMLHDLRKQGFVGSATGMHIDEQRANVATTLITLQHAYNQLESLTQIPDLDANRNDIKNLQTYLTDVSAELRNFAQQDMGVDFSSLDPWKGKANSIKNSLNMNTLVEQGFITETQRQAALEEVRGKTKNIHTQVKGWESRTTKDVNVQVHNLEYEVDRFRVVEFQETETYKEFIHIEDPSTAATRRPGDNKKVGKIEQEEYYREKTKARVEHDAVGDTRRIKRTIIETESYNERTEYDPKVTIATIQAPRSVSKEKVMQMVYDQAKETSAMPVQKTEFLNGYVLSGEEKADVVKINAFYRRQAAALRDGIEAGRLQEFRAMKSQSLKLTEQLTMYENAKALSDDERRAGLRELHKEIKKLRDNVKTQQTYVDNNGLTKDRLDPANSFLYHAQMLNYDALLARIELSEIKVSGEHISSDKVAYLNRRVARFQEVGMVMNSGQIFAGLGNTVTQLAEHTLFTGKTKAAGTADYEDPTKKVITAIKEVGDAFGGEGQGEMRQAAQKKFAIVQIDETIKMYEDRLSQLNEFSKVRESQSKLKGRDGNTRVKSDEEMDARIHAAHMEYENRTKETIRRLEMRKADINGKSMRLDDYDDIFTDIRLDMEDLDRSNLQLAEVFRSPTPGGTDPRLHTYRLMEGVYALNRVSQLAAELQVGETGIPSQKMTMDVDRGQTGSWMASLGIVTYGGGDWDGDPYTTVLIKVSDLQKEMQSQRMNFQQKRILRDQYQKQLRQRLDLNPDADVSDLQEKINNTRKAEINSEARFKEAQAQVQEQSALGSRMITDRMRKQVSNFLGMDERFFVAEGEAVYDPITGNQKTDSQGRLMTGLGGRTMGADELNALMGQGTDIIEGAHKKAGQMITTNIALDAILGMKHGDPGDALMFLDNMRIAGKIHQAEGNSAANVPVIELREQINKRMTFLQAQVDAGNNSNTEQLNFLKSLAAEGADSDVLRAYAGSLSDFMDSQESYEKYSAMMKQVESGKVNKEASQRAFLYQWVGGEIFNKIQENDTLGKFMSQAVGMDMTEPVFDIVLKTLGKAGGEILGKTYNTIIGTTFQDAPTISTGRAMMDENSELFAAVKRHYYQDGAEIDINKLSESQRKRVQGYAAANGVSIEEAARTMFNDEFDAYIKTTQSAVTKAEATQGFMKNIHQLLRDSIKLKAADGKALMDSLQKSADSYNEKSTLISEYEQREGGIENLSAEEKETYRGLKLSRDGVINNMASQLGPGPGLKSLMNMDFLINQAQSKTLSITEYEARYLNGGRLTGKDGAVDERNMELEALDARLSATRSDYTSIFEGGTGRLSINQDSVSLMTLARYQTARNVASLVASYRMNNNIDQGIEHNKSFAADHKKALLLKGASAKVVDIEGNRFSEANPSDASSQMMEYLYTKYIGRDASNTNFDADFDYKYAMAQHALTHKKNSDLEMGKMFDENGNTTDSYRNALLNAATDVGGLEEYMLQFDSVYSTSRAQLDPLFGAEGERMEMFSLTELMRKNLANAQETGNRPGGKASDNIRNIAGSELLQTMAQLSSTEKVGAQGMGIFSAMYRGVLTELINANKEVLDSDGKNFSTADQVEQEYIIKKTVYKNLLGTAVSEDQPWTRATSDDTRDWKANNARMIDEAEERYVYQEGDGKLSVVTGSGQYKGSGKLIRVENDVLDAFVAMNERTLSGEQAAAAEMMGRQALYEYAMDDQELDRIVADFMPGDHKTSQENVEYMKQNIQYQAARRQNQVIKQQKLARELHMSMNDVTKRGSVLNNIGDASLRALSKNKVSTGLDVIVPFLLTGIGGMIQEGNIDDNQIQALGGGMVTAFQYARAGTIDDPDPAAYKRKISTAKAFTGVFKFKNALARHGDDNVGMAIAEMATQEVVSTAFNAIATPKISSFIETNVLGMKAHPSLSAMNMEKYAAGKQLAGNIGASVISAVSSTLITGLFMKTGAAMANGGMKNILDSFAPVAQLAASVSERISRQRNQQAAYEEMAAETDGTEAELTSYWVMTDASYNPDSYAHLADLQEARDIEPDMDGTIYTDVLV